jgi:hypothetical protein
MRGETEKRLLPSQEELCSMEVFHSSRRVFRWASFDRGMHYRKKLHPQRTRETMRQFITDIRETLRSEPYV